ncbi:MAG: nitrite/sulfite reductase [Candidatus Dormibacteria bacterium]|jgi:sulfite reductase beta subunit-like hemoprotein
MIGEQELAIPPVVAAEIEEFERRAQAFAAGEESEETFKPYRLSYGIYGQRQDGYQMVRVKIPHGRLTAAQLEALADFSERFCDEGEYPGGGGRGMGHITTRQDVQFHFVPLARVPEAMRHLARAGLTTREACFNTVRNITGCPLAGACGTEAFDITPYAQAATELFLRNPICQNLPRKFKIAFSGCETDCGLGAMHDIGAVARVQDGERGFKVWVGGGLGNSPRPATLLYEFVPVRRFYPVIEAIIRVFDAEGPRKNRNRARIKFLFDRTYTAATFRARVEEEVALLPSDAWSHRILDGLPERVDGEAGRRETLAPLPTFSIAGVARGVQYARWRATNVSPHRLDGYGLVSLRLALGDISATQLRVAAEAARRWSGGEARASAGQNLVLRDVRLDELSALYDFLLPHGLAEAEALGIRDVVTCPGADTCNLGITSSRGLGRAVSRWLDDERLQDLPEFAGTSIKASGCPNSCSQHHIATIGFYGNSKHVGDDPVPHYMLMLGGGIDARGARMAQPVMKIPARRVPAALERLVAQYREERGCGELFAAWVERADRDAVKARLADLTLSDAPSAEEIVDWDQEAAFTGKTGEGECAV